MMWLLRLLNHFGLRQDTCVCMRQEQTWCWPEDLGRMTPGHCAECGSPIYFEIQNRPFRKICNQCAGL